MSTRPNTFIDAYGIDLTDESGGTFSPSSRNESAVPSRSVQTELAVTQRRQYRVDAVPSEPAPSSPALRKPHFQLRAAEPQTPVSETANEAISWDDMSVIDVGAGWSPTPTIEEPLTPSVESPSIDGAATETKAIPVEKLEPVTMTEPPKETVAVENLVAERAKTVANPEPPIEQPATVIDAQNVAVAEPALDTQVQDEQAEARLEAESVRAPAKTSLPVVSPVVPAWEVDRFHWPTNVETLFEEQADYFEHAGHKLLTASREGLSTLAITSAQSGEGTTTVALCLARAISAVGGRVAVLDGNLGNPQIGKALSLEFASGWQLAAAGAVDLAEAAIAGIEERITLFPAGVAKEGASDLGDESVRELLRRAGAGFDLLIIDAGQDGLGASAEAIDAAMVVRDVRHTSHQQSVAAALLLKEAGVNAVGIAENFTGRPEAAAAA